MSVPLNKVETLGGGSMLSIEGLNKKQMAMLDIIWSCRNEKQFVEWFLSLSEIDRQTVESLFEILRQEYLEMVVRETPMNDVEALLERIKRGPSTEA